MKRIHLIALALFVLLTIAAGVASTQSVNQPAAAVEGPRTRVTSDVGIAPVLPGMFEPLTTGGLLDGLFVRNQPYSATFESETVRRAPDGTSNTSQTVTRVWRDANGRTRREQIFYPTGAIPSATDAAQSVVIFDPAAGWGYALNQANRTAQRHRLPATLPLGTLFDNQVPLLVKILRQENPAAGTPPQSFTLAAPLALPLGIQTINGVAATGRRVTLRLPAGAVGNQAAVDAVYETWIAADLQMLVKAVVGNPASGTHTFQLKTISRANPAPGLFAVPSDYATSEMGAIRTDLPPPNPTPLNASPLPSATQAPAQ